MTFQTPGWWSGIISLGIAMMIAILSHKFSFTVPAVENLLGNIFEWIYRAIWWGYRTTTRVLIMITRILEGEGSVLWALLILIILIVSISIWASQNDLEFR